MRRRAFFAGALGGGLGAGLVTAARTEGAAGKAARNQVYQCPSCGNIVQVRHAGRPGLLCCGKAMVLLVEKTKDKGLEKHVPVVEKVADGIKVKVGSVAHPMVKGHYIEWIEVIADGNSCCKFLKPGAKPEAFFSAKTDNVTVREYCTLHGLWKR